MSTLVGASRRRGAFRCVKVTFCGEVGGLAIRRAEKEQIVQSVAERMRRSKSIVLADYRGLTVAEDTELRARLRQAGIDYSVVKNTLTTRAAEQAEIEGLEPFLTGPTAIAFSYDDPVAPAKILHEFSREHKALELKGGYVEGKVVDAKEIEALAKLPSREGLLSMLLSVLQAPMRNLAYVLSQVAEKQGGEAAPAAE